MRFSATYLVFWFMYFLCDTYDPKVTHAAATSLPLLCFVRRSVFSHTGKGFCAYLSVMWVLFARKE